MRRWLVAMALGLMAWITFASAVFLAFGSSYSVRSECGPAIGLAFVRPTKPGPFLIFRCSDHVDEARRLTGVAGGLLVSALGLFGGAWVVVRRRQAGGPGSDAPQVSLA